RGRRGGSVQDRDRAAAREDRLRVARAARTGARADRARPAGHENDPRGRRCAAKASGHRDPGISLGSDLGAAGDRGLPGDRGACLHRRGRRHGDGASRACAEGDRNVQGQGDLLQPEQLLHDEALPVAQVEGRAVEARRPAQPCRPEPRHAAASVRPRRAALAARQGGVHQGRREGGVVPADDDRQPLPPRGAEKGRRALRRHGALHGLGLGGLQPQVLGARRRSGDYGLTGGGMETARDRTDATQQRPLDYAALTPRAAHEATVRVIDTLTALAGGFDGEACVVARRMAARVPDAEGATVYGTAMKTTPDLAAFANATAARYVELNDVYHWPGSAGGHPSDVVMPLMGVAEHARASGRDLIAAVVLAYEIYLRLSDAIGRTHFDCANFACLGVAAASGRLLKLTREQTGHAMSMAAVPNNILRRVRTGHLSMWKAVTAGHAGKAGVFAALLAREGMDGPPQPFE